MRGRAVDCSIVHCLDQLPLEIRVSFGLRDEQEMALLTRRVEGAPDQVAGESCGCDRVGDEPDRVARACAKAPRDDVRPVPGLANGSKDPCLDGSRDPRLLAPAREHERCAVCETPALRATSARVTRGPPARLTTFPLSTSLDKSPRSPIIPHVLFRFSSTLLNPVAHRPHSLEEENDV